MIINQVKNKFVIAVIVAFISMVSLHETTHQQVCCLTCCFELASLVTYLFYTLP